MHVYFTREGQRGESTAFWQVMGEHYPLRDNFPVRAHFWATRAKIQGPELVRHTCCVVERKALPMASNLDHTSLFRLRRVCSVACETFSPFTLTHIWSVISARFQSKVSPSINQQQNGATTIITCWVIIRGAWLVNKLSTNGDETLQESCGWDT